jgi:cysteine desulfurase
MDRIYLDYAATTPVAPEVVDAMLPYLNEQFGNPSSIHSFGQETKAAIEDAREVLARNLGARSEEIFFTSGGTESNNLAFKGVASANRHKGRHIITSAIEHHAVLEPCHFLETQGFSVTYLPVDRDGIVDPDDVRKAITDDTILISVMHANNEIGTIEPLAKIGQIAKAREVYFHTDAVQTFGHLPINVNELSVDLLSMSAHKLYGPKGAGALFVRKGTQIAPLFHGGDQERRFRASTENVPGIMGFAKAVELACAEMPAEMQRHTALRETLQSALFERIEDIHVNGHPSQRLPNNLNLSIDGVDSESLLLNLDLNAIAASSGAACSSGSLDPSHVLLALGRSRHRALSSLRLTLGRHTTMVELQRVADVLPGIVKTLRAGSPIYPS